MSTSELEKARGLAKLIGVYLTIAMTVIGAVIMLVWMHRMPNPAAVHWDGAGNPDGFANPWVNFYMFLLSSVVFLLLNLGFLVVPKPAKQAVWGPINRFIPAVVFGGVAMMQIMAVGSFYVQLDVADARESGSTLGTLIAGFVALVLLSVAAYFLQPKLTITRQNELTAADLEADLDADGLTSEAVQPAVWRGDVPISKAAYIIYGFAALMVLGSLVMVLAAEASWGVVMLMAVTLLLVLFGGIVGFSYRLRVDDSGVAATAKAGWPTFRVPIEDVASVSVAEVAPFAEFGGWGLRWIPGGFGIVLRTGEALVVKRKNGNTFTVTVDDAEGAAKVLLRELQTRQSF